MTHGEKVSFVCKADEMDAELLCSTRLSGFLRKRVAGRGGEGEVRAAVPLAAVAGVAERRGGEGGGHKRIAK